MSPSRVGLPGSVAEALLDQAPDAVLLVDTTGVIRFANPAVTRLLGYPSDALVGRLIETLVPDRYRDSHSQVRATYEARPAVREMGARVVALAARREDGGEVPVEIRLAPVEVDGLTFTVATVRDVSERRAMVEELKSARLAAERADRAKTRFLATASHDLRQPLQTLQLLAGALLRQVSSGSAAELVNRQLRALDGMAELLNTLLDVSKLESGAVQPVRSSVALPTLFAELGRHFEAAAAARRLRLSVSCAPVAVHTDRVLLRQLLQNLLNNAIKFTPRGGVSLAATESAEGVRITVQDTGIGIPAGELERIFDEYYQVASGSSEQRGFGLGLTIVRQLARILGLTLAVDSAPGSGTAFNVLVPPALCLGPAAVESGVPAGVAVGEASLKPRVLIVEDDGAVRTALELLLSLDGYPVRSAATASAAIAAFRDEGDGIDIVLTDYHLDDGATGLGVLRTLRELAGRDLPAVVLSGDTSPILASLAGLNRVRVLRKPVDAAVLVTTMEELFGGT
jgi:two-component system, sensor histidine kinase